MKPSSRSLFCWIAALLAPMAAPVWAAPAAAPEPPHRLLVLSDIEADPDDTQSFVRLFLYANQIELQGLVATTSVWKRDSIAPESIHALIDAYAKVHGNLLLHDKRYPTAEALHGLVRKGSPEYGMLGVGVGKDTEGSARIIELVERDDDRPLWISVWGGANTLAQALHSLRATRSPAEVDRLVAKLRVYTISDQDDSGPWLRSNFPGLFYIVTPGGDYGSATWTGIHTVIEGIDNATISNRWIATHIQQGHGPLGAAYPDVAWGLEGDTPAFLGLIPNGLNAPEHPEWGGWGGRYTLSQPVVPIADEKTFLAGTPIPQETRPIWTNAIDDYAPTTFPEHGRSTRLGEKSFRSAQASLWRWRDEFQNDFAARIDWTVRPFADANHPPVPVLDRAAVVTVSSGQSFGFDARRSHDPDGDSLSFLWMPYREAGSSDAVLKINGTENAVLVALTAPEVTKTETCHLILKVTDRGTPALTRYQRIVVTVTPCAN